jgi:two-component system cell cycle response regulator DivK
MDDPVTPARGTVMVVEDTIDTRLVLTLSLQHMGYFVITAANGEEAVEIAKRAQPDLILMDLNMPRCDGLAATRLIRKSAKLRDVPILAVTAYNTRGMKEAAFEAGCNAFITKPIDFKRLEEIVGQFLHKIQQSS